MVTRMTEPERLPWTLFGLTVLHASGQDVDLVMVKGSDAALLWNFAFNLATGTRLGFPVVRVIGS